MPLRFRRYGLALNVEISWHSVSDTFKFPWLKPSGFLQCMVETDTVGKLCGDLSFDEMESTCLQFWRNYSFEYPTHQVFEAARDRKLALARTIPTYLFGDEGRSFKKVGIMCVSLQGLIGRGTRPFLQTPVAAESDKAQKLNLKGSSLNSRFLIAAMPKKMYSKNNQVHIDFIEAMIDDLRTLQNTGFRWHGRQWYIQVLGLKGDLPFLQKTAGLTRHWLRAQRKQSTARQPAGICWLCEAGKKDIPFEDCNENAAWFRLPCTPPWSTPPAFLKLHHLSDAPQKFLKTDLFHNLHGGIGKDFCASSLAEILVLFLAPGSLIAKCAEMDRELRRWARKVKQALPHSGGFSKERISLTSYQVCPDASWAKHADTTIYMRFIQSLLEQKPEKVRGDPTLKGILTACKAMNECLSILYRGGLWLTPQEATEAGSKGRIFVLTYCRLAWDCHARGSLRYPMHAKLHMVDHHMRWLAQRGATGRYVLNVLAESNQQDEEPRSIKSWFFLWLS